MPEDKTLVKELLEEAEFYQIQGMIDELVPNETIFPPSTPTEIFLESDILINDEHQKVLKAWLSPLQGKWRLLFRASRDGFAAETFHSKCDNLGPTVTIVKNGHYIFGGFTDVSWTRSKFARI